MANPAVHGLERIRPPSVPPDPARTAAAVEVLRTAAGDFAPAVLATSLSIEDMTLADMLWREGLSVEVVTLDTGRLPEETLAFLTQVERHYGRPVRVARPDPAAVADYVARHGADGFYASVELRRACCAIRKVEPLRRALVGKRAWITGQRRASSPTRKGLAVFEQDPVTGLAKFNPLAEWSTAEVWGYIRAFAVPYNPLYDAGYASIGCAPCTRAIAVGEDERAGRWWWESPETKECGLHARAHIHPLGSAGVKEAARGGR